MRTTSWAAFGTLEASVLLSSTGNGITMVAFPWLVLQETGSPTAAATIAAVATLPLVVSMLFSGAIIDMVGRRPVAVVSDLLSMGSVLAVPALAAATELNVLLLGAVALLGAVFDPAGLTAREAMLPEAAARAGLRLERANGIHESAFGFAFLLGPGIGGLLISWFGAVHTFWATGIAFAVSAVLIGISPTPGSGRPAAHERPKGLLSATGAGLRYLWADQVLRESSILFAALILVWLPIESVILPVYFNGIDEPAQLGFLITAMSGGGVVGALLYAAVGPRISRRTAFVSSLVLCAVPVLGMSLLPPYPWMIVLGVLTGLFFGSVNPIINLAIQHRTTNDMRGRVNGIYGSVANVAGPLGYLIAGPLITAIDVERAFQVMAVLVFIASASAVFMGSLRRLDDPPIPGSAASDELLHLEVTGAHLDVRTIGVDTPQSPAVPDHPPTPEPPVPGGR